MSDLIYLVAGARPNFMKIAPLISEMKNQNLKYKLVHTGQHYDYSMSKVFFDSLNIPEPDYYLNAGSGTHAVQTAKIMVEFEKILLKDKPFLIIVVGDVNSTIACALVAKKLFIDVAHVEAGLRSYDRRMPEEINRLLTDQIADLLFTTEKTAEINLKREGVDESKIHFVGNVMIDTLINNLEKAKKLNTFRNYGLEKGFYALLTIHRPSNVDSEKDLAILVDILNIIQRKIKIVFPIHPRTQKNLESYHLKEKLNTENILIIKPVGYLEFLNLMIKSKCIITDSGGIQEEASYLKIPVLTLRENTERPITVEKGTNTIVHNDIEKIKLHIDEILSSNYKKGQEIEKWDGNSAKRIIKIIKEKYLSNNLI
ncbi:MAG: non-hydrolyzing UDP-N-acetylglucosamine 2-epimerase [Candidatus Hermodarchaeota archaeon]